MTREQIIAQIAKDADTTKVAAKAAMDSMLTCITKALKKGRRVSLVGFGTFSVSKRDARQGRNPRTGSTIQIAARKVARFKAGKGLADAEKSSIEIAEGVERRRLVSKNMISRRKGSLRDIKKYENSSKVFKTLFEVTELPINFIAENVFEVTPKTLSKYKNEDVKIPSVISELAVKFQNLCELGEEVLGSAEEFNAWLVEENIGLGNIKPSELLNTSTGIDLIYEELKRIEFGATA